MRRTLGCVVAALALASGCAHDAALTPLRPLAPTAALAEPEARLVLIGDAGVAADAPNVLDEAKRWIAEHPAATTVVFLGDNFYARRADASVAAVFARQRAVAADDAAIFVPGNHDWHPRGFRTSDGFERTRLDALAAASGARWEPADGALGPAEIAPAHGRFRVLAIDSEAWRVAAARCERRGSASDCAARDAAQQRLATALACTDCAPAVVVAHHPLRTVGEHGGCGLPWLARTLEIGGQDVATPPYQAYVASLERALAKQRPLLFAAGHDHSLQFARDSAVGAHLVSGAGAKRSAVCGEPGRAWSRNGFASVDFPRDGAPLLRVFAQDDGGVLQEVLREPLQP